MTQCVDCGKSTKAKTGICRQCSHKRKEHWERERKRFGCAVDRVWQRIGARKAASNR